MKKFSIILMILIIAFLFGCNKKSDGRFKVVDGKELFFEGEEQIIDRLVSYEGNQYYISEEGTKVKNGWAIIDNDDTYAYFGSKGMMIKNTVREINDELFFFDKEGKLVTDRYISNNLGNFYATKDGRLLKNQFKIIDKKDHYFKENGIEIKLATNSWVYNDNSNNLGDLPSGDFYLDSNNQRVKNKWIGEYYVGDDGLLQTNTWIETNDGKVYINEYGKKSTPPSKPQPKPSYKNLWQLKYFTDTNEKYLYAEFEGKYGMPAGYLTQDFDLIFLIDDNYVCTTMYNGNENLVQFSYAEYKIQITTNDGKVYDFNGEYSEDRLYFEDIGKELLLACLKNSNIFRVTIIPDNDFSYKFEAFIEPDNFKELYWN